MKRRAKRTAKSLECLPAGESEHDEAESDEWKDGDATLVSGKAVIVTSYIKVCGRSLGSFARSLPVSQGKSDIS
jgi:hypothetical protein